MAGTQSQQLFLQAMMAHGAQSEADTKRLFRSCQSACGEHERADLFERFMSGLNRDLKSLDMELVHSRLEDSNERWYGLVNRTADPAAKIASGYSPAELEFFNKVMEQIVTNDGIASSTALINAACELERKLSATGAQTFLKSLIKQKWLKEVPGGKYGPGPRFILELRPFLSDVFKEDIVKCKICKDPVIRGDACGNESCAIKLHPLCVARIAAGRESIKCPGCHGDWTCEIPDIELPERDDDTGPSLQTPATSNSRSKTRKNNTSGTAIPPTKKVRTNPLRR